MDTIYLYAEVYEGDAARVVEQLRTAREVTVRINSPGGAVGDGLAIYRALRAHPHPVTVAIDGFCLSIASVIAMAGAHIVIADNGVLMIHDPWLSTTGNAADLQRNAEALEKIADAMLAAYARTGIPRDELRALMRAETWFTADEARQRGFVDEVASTAAIAACFDLSRFRNVPLEIKNMPPPAASNPSPSVPGIVASSGAAPVAAAETVGINALRARNTEVRQIFGAFRRREGFPELEAEMLDDVTLNIEQVRARLLTKLGEGQHPAQRRYELGEELGSHIDAGSDRLETFKAAATDALLMRAGIPILKPHPAARDLDRMPVLAMAESIASQVGVRMKDRSWRSVLAAAHTTSDFPGLLANTANKALQLGYDNEPASHRQWVRDIDVNDFKEQSRIARSEAPQLLEVLEGADYQHGSFSERREAYALATWGRVFSITRQALVNDDLMAFTDLPFAFGAAAARLEADKVYGILTSNPVMSDGVSLFHASHANLAATGSALAVATLGAGRTAMRLQRGLKGEGYLNVVPAFLIVPATLETVAEQLIASITDPAAAAAGVDNPSWIRKLTLVVDARLDAVSTTAWYLAGNKLQIDTVEIAYLRGQRGVYTEENIDFMSDAFNLKARLDFQAAAIDWRGLYRNPGP